MKNILKKKFLFRPYSKVDLVLLDDNCSNLNFNFLKFKTIRSDEINLFHLVVAFFKFILSFNNFKFKDVYFIEIINKLDPKIGLGCDVNFRIYKFLKYFPKKKSIIYQFGFYNFKYIELFKKNILKFTNTKKIKCDYFFIWDKKFKDYFYYFDTKFIVNGSTRSNEIKKTKIKKKYDIMYVSSFRHQVKSYHDTNQHYLTMTVSDAMSSYLLTILNNLKIKKKLKICLALASNRKEKTNRISSFHEIDFIKRDLKNFIVEKKNSYDLASKSNLIVTTHSTLGVELLARGHKVLFINPDFFFYNENIIKNFKNFFHVTTSNKKAISKSIMNLLKFSDKKWKINFSKTSFKIPYDEKNKILKNLLIKLL